MCQIKSFNNLNSSFFSRLKNYIISFFKKMAWVFEKGLATVIRKIIKRLEREKRYTKGVRKKISDDSSPLNLKPGDIVRILSKEDIFKTLDEERKLEGCYFMEEMAQYCGSVQKVLKRVNYFYDEGKMRMFKTYNIVLLEGLNCSGKTDSSEYNCDRSCYFFWKENWLEKI